MISTIPEKHARIVAWFVIGIAFYIVPVFLSTFANIHMASGNMYSWLPDTSEQRDTFQEFAECFESYDSMLISWDGATTDSPLINQIAKAIIVQDRTNAYYTGQDPYISNIRTFRGFIELFGKDKASDPAFVNRAKELAAGFLTFKDPDEGFISLETTSYGSKNQGSTFELVDEVVRKILPEGIEPKYTGPCYLATCSNRSMWSLFTKMFPFTTVISFVLAVIFLRTIKLASIAFGVSLFASTCLLSVMHYTGREMGDFLVLVPSLTQLLAMSNVIHLINYYKESIEEQGDKRVAWRVAISQGWLPTTAASVSTAVGLGALFLSEIYLVREFAVFGILGVLFSMIVVLSLTTPLLILIQPDVRSSLPIQTSLIRAIDLFVNRRKTIITIVLTSILIYGAVGLRHLQSDATLNSLFRDDAPFRQDADWYSSQMGPALGSDLLVTFPIGINIDEQFQLIEKIAEGIEGIDPEYTVFSPSIFDKLMPDASVEERWKKVTESSLGVQSLGKTYWRLMIRHPIDPDPNKSKFRKRSNQVIEQIIAEAPMRDRYKPKAQLTGFVNLFLTTQSGLIRQMLNSFLCAFVIITPLIMLFLRKFWIGLIAIIGNLYPLVVFFGILGWLNFRVDIATMMIATVAFGIAVDDTVHFLTWLSRGLRNTDNLKQAISYALEHSAGAILQTTIIISSGMSVYLLSDFIPSVRFASFSAIVLIIAVIGDLVLLPAMILGIFRGFFEKPSKISSANISPSLHPRK